MTINVGLVTSEALVFGCDSIASSTEYLVNPFELKWPKDARGKQLVDADGKQLISLDMDKVQPVVTNSWGDVTKMCVIHGGPTPVVSVTAGLARLNNRTIKSLCEEFAAKKWKKRLLKVADVATEFLAFFRKEYDKHYKGSPVPAQFQDGPEFLVGGYGKADPFPSLLRVKVKENTVEDQFSNGKSGLAWNGQSDAVERLIRGYDGALREHIQERIDETLDGYHKNMTAAMTRILDDVLKKLGAALPAGVDTTLPAQSPANIQWEKCRLTVGYGNLPLQDVVDFVAYLVLLQSGRAKFGYGVATVGGRTHIGVVTKADGFKMLDEPSLRHRHTGFADDK